jgi:NSS family neurotransmitter:Na+ symporter
MSQREQWSSRWSFILATTGAAVGLGNIWRFPYMAGMNGGSAFVLVYLICVVLIALPVLVAEIIIGRRARANPVDALTTLATDNNHSKRWGILGWWGATALLMVLSFYSVVSGWSIAYFFKSISGTFDHLSADKVEATWGALQSQPLQLLSWHTLFMIATIAIVIRGVNKGIEKATNIMMPLLYIILISLVFYALKQGNTGKALHFLFDFNLHSITPSVVIAAMGHAFFSMAVGAGAMLTYGAYAPKRINVINSVLIVATLDILVAILSGLAIFPIIFAEHLAPTSGPGLMFISLPMSFAHMEGGSFVAAGFFALLFFASLTSSINLIEPLIMILMDKVKLTRKKAAIMIGIAAWSLGIVSLLSFNVWDNVKLFGQTPFDLISNGATDIFLPIGGLAFAVFAGWVMKKKDTESELSNARRGIYCLWRILIRYIAPIGVVLVLISPLLG